MESFATIVNGIQPLTIVTKLSILVWMAAIYSEVAKIPSPFRWKKKSQKCELLKWTENSHCNRNIISKRKRQIKGKRLLANRNTVGNMTHTRYLHFGVFLLKLKQANSRQRHFSRASNFSRVINKELTRWNSVTLVNVTLVSTSLILFSLNGLYA